MWGWFARKKELNLKVDIHSHLLPGIDDGVKSAEESLQIIRSMASMGFEKLITTPHIYPDFYPNTPEIIRGGLAVIQSEIAKAGIRMQLEAAAEYYVDASFKNSIAGGEEILSFGEEKYVLFETGFQTKPVILEETIFELKAHGFTPLFAHPERYDYLEAKSDLFKELQNLGIKTQISLPSLKGYYGSLIRKKAETYLKLGAVDFLGSDIHRANQLNGLNKALKIKIPDQKLNNNELI